MRVVFIHGACVRDGSWWWHRAAAALAARDVASATALLPSCGETGITPGPDGAGLTEDAAVVRRLLQDSAEPTVIVGHSYGGIVAAEAAAGIDAVSHFLLISSYLPHPGESLSTFGDRSPAPFLDVDPEGGTFGVRPESMADTFLQDCSPGIVADSLRHLARQSVSVTQQPVTSAAWQQASSTYLVCTEDRGTPAANQREFARRADAVIELDTGHHPFLARPDAVAELILQLG